FTPSGQLDTSFGVGGKVDTDMSGNSIDQGQSLLVDSVGRLILSGYAYKNGFYDFAVARYLPNGQLDSNFGTGGTITTPVGTANALALGPTLQGDGNLLVAGFAPFPTTGNDFTVGRYITTPPPTANAGGPYTVAEGSSVVLDGSGSSDPDQPADTLT